MIFRFWAHFKSVLESKHSISHAAEQGPWNQVGPLDQDVVVLVVGFLCGRGYQKFHAMFW